VLLGNTKRQYKTSRKSWSFIFTRFAVIECHACEPVHFVLDDMHGYLAAAACGMAEYKEMTGG
jgi:hypothetical protein